MTEGEGRGGGGGRGEGGAGGGEGEEQWEGEGVFYRIGVNCRIWTKISTTPAGSCITDSLSHITYVETNYFVLQTRKYLYLIRVKLIKFASLTAFRNNMFTSRINQKFKIYTEKNRCSARVTITKNIRHNFYKS